MKTSITSVIAVVVLVVLSVAVPGGCRRFSEEVHDPAAGINGGFEIARNGLPVNWLMYTPNTVPNADFRIVLDRQVFKEGRQSLRFDVKRCAARGGGWHSPGFTNEFFDKGKGRFGEGRYRISFWVRNGGAAYFISAGGVAYSKNIGGMHSLVNTNVPSDDWKRLEYVVDVPKGCHLRMQLTIWMPGTFWIDDIRVKRIDGGAA